MPALCVGNQPWSPNPALPSDSRGRLSVLTLVTIM